YGGTRSENAQRTTQEGAQSPNRTDAVRTAARHIGVPRTTPEQSSRQRAVPLFAVEARGDLVAVEAIHRAGYRRPLPSAEATQRARSGRQGPQRYSSPRAVPRSLGSRQATGDIGYLACFY